MRKIKIITIFFIAIIIFLSVPVFFVAVSPFVGYFITDILGIRINPVLSGGEVMAAFNDDPLDDKGTGTYTYPTSEAYQPYKNHLDLVKYTVKKPVHNGTWGDYKHFWTFEVVMGSLANSLHAPAGFSFPVINIFISINGAKGGRTDTAFPGANISFDPKHPWHYFVKVYGWEIDGKLYDWNNEYLGKVLVDIIKDKKEKNKLRLTVPTGNVPVLMSLTDKDITFHYVMIGNYDPVESENFRAVSYSAGVTTGGGSICPEFSPRIYDYLAPAGESQYKILSGYNAANKKFTVLRPVKVGHHEIAKFQE